METKRYQAVVVGAGPGGYPCAIRLAQLGVETLCIEKEYWGGVCLNVGCIPSKALITAGKRLHEIRKAGAMGIQVSGEATLDIPTMQAWKGSVVKKLTNGVQALLKGNGADRMSGTARLVGPGALEVETAEGTVRVESDHIVLATGSRPVEIPGFSFADPRIMDSTRALDIQDLPERVVVIGGGYIGLELGSVLNKFGSHVTVVEFMDQLMPGFDPDVVKVIARKLKKNKVDIKLKSKALGWEEGENGAVVTIETPKGTESLETDEERDEESDEESDEGGDEGRVGGGAGQGHDGSDAKVCAVFTDGATGAEHVVAER